MIDDCVFVGCTCLAFCEKVKEVVLQHGVEELVVRRIFYTSPQTKLSKKGKFNVGSAMTLPLFDVFVCRKYKISVR